MRYLSISLVSLVLTLVLMPGIIKFCRARSWYDYPSPRKIHQLPTPRIGGVAIFISCVIAWTLAYLLWPDFASDSGNLTLWLLLGGLVVFGLGLWDDLKTLRFRYKILVESLLGISLILAGLRIRILFIPFWQPIELGWTSGPLTLLWFLGLLNSINLIDGLDGLAAGVSAIAAATLFLVGLHFQVYLVAFLMITVWSACLGFLKYNFSPAKIFMGDSGSLFLGYLFAVSSLICPIKSFTAIAMLVPLLALGIPALETLSSFLRRSVKLQKFYAADNQHIHNLLLNLGMSQKATIITLYVASILFSGLSLLLMTEGHELALPIFVSIIALALAAWVTSYILKYRIRTRGRQIPT